MCMVIRHENMGIACGDKTEEHVLWLRDKTCSSVLMSFKKNLFFCSHVFKKTCSSVLMSFKK